MSETCGRCGKHLRNIVHTCRPTEWARKIEAERDQLQAALSATVEQRDRLLEALKNTAAMLEIANCSTGYCCCGSSIDSHGMGDGHSPVDDGDYYQMLAIEKARAAIASVDQSLALAALRAASAVLKARGE